MSASRFERGVHVNTMAAGYDSAEPSQLSLALSHVTGSTLTVDGWWTA